MATSIDLQIKCLSKEIRRRKAKFPKIVADGKMNSEDAALEIQTMQDALETLTQLKGLVLR